MNAANASLQSSSIENERRAHEPSMEEILASIRKIIADDDALPLSRAADPRPILTPRPFENVSTFAPPPPAPVEEPVALRPSVDEAPEPVVARAPAVEPSPEPAASPEAAQRAHVEQAPETDPAAYAPPPALDAAEMASFEEIAEELAAREPEPAAEAAAPARAPAKFSPPAFAPAEPAPILSAEADASISSAFQALSATVQLTNHDMIERHVRDMLRPMLKQWLDDNLPVMVERLVRAEIERVARGGR